LTAHVWDKLLHTAEYGGLAFLLCRAWRGEGFRGRTATLLAVLLASLYGASDEWHESFVPLRTPDVLDWLADTLGSAIGAVAFIASVRVSGSFRRRKNEPCIVARRS